MSSADLNFSGNQAGRSPIESIGCSSVVGAGSLVGVVVVVGVLLVSTCSATVVDVCSSLMLVLYCYSITFFDSSFNYTYNIS